MNILSIIGPLGSGKTTLTLKIFKELESLGFDTKKKFAYVVNDEGAFVDGELAKERAQVIAMTNGCFTCSDTADLKKNLDKLETEGIEWIFLEGFGITAGNETRDFLESNHWPFHVICTLSFKHFERDIVRYSNVVQSQVEAATKVIGLTKYPAEITNFMNLNNHDIFDFLGKHNSGISVSLLPSGDSVPKVIINLFTEDEQKMENQNGDCKHYTSCGCSHSHSDGKHHHHHEEPFYPYSFKLQENTSLEMVKDCFKDKNFLLRIKGSVGGNLFNEIHDEWIQDTKDKRQFITFYTTREISIEKDLPKLLEIILLEEVDTSENPSYLQLRVESGINIEDTVTEIKHLLSELPKDPIIIKAGNYIRVLTHPEIMQTLKDGIARRPSVKDEWFPKVLKECMIYWIKCADIINKRRDEILPEDIGKNLRELAVSLVWWVNRYPDYFGIEVVNATKEVRPGFMAIEGIQFMDSLNSDKERAGWQHSELSEALFYAIENGEDYNLVLEASEHCFALSDNEDIRKAWAETTSKIKN